MATRRQKVGGVAAVAALAGLCATPLVVMNTGNAASPATPAPAARAAAASTVRIGMSAPASQWSARLRETGPVKARRLFGDLADTTRTVRLARSEVAAGRYPILSFKIPKNDWMGVARGKYDRKLRTLTKQLDAIPGPLFVSLHHEPEGNGRPAAWAAMQSHALPILSRPRNVHAGVIGNGFWWSSKKHGLTDAQIAKWLPRAVLRKAEIVAADTYQSGSTKNPGNDTAAQKIRNMSAWATRHKVRRLGLGEYNGHTASAVKAAGNAILADRRFVFAAIFNSNRNNREGVTQRLTGTRLRAFKVTLRKARVRARAQGVPAVPGGPGSTPSPTAPAPTFPTATPAPSAPVPGGPSRTLIGMSAPAKQFEARLAETGPVQARRLFGKLESSEKLVRLAESEIAVGRYPILSFKIPGNDWAGVGAGKYDSQLRELTAQLDALPGQLFVALHHEPEKDGTAADYAAMQRHALPILGAPSNVDSGVIANGFWWSEEARGLSDGEIAQWLPADVLKRAEIIAADTYQAGSPNNPAEGAAPKIRSMSAWATRVGVSRLGLGEYNGLTSGSITEAGDAVLADKRFAFASIFNSNVNNRAGLSLQLTGDRLSAFRGTLAKAYAGS